MASRGMSVRERGRRRLLSRDERVLWELFHPFDQAFAGEPAAAARGR